MRPGALILGVLLLTPAALAAPQFGRFRKNGLGSTVAPVANTFTELLTSNPGTECGNNTITASGGETVTFTRGSSAYCTASTGAMTLRSSNQPRVANKGYFAEGAGASISTQPEALNHADWTCAATVTANQAAPPWGGSGMDDVASSSNNCYQCVFMSSSAGPFTISGYGKTAAGTSSGALSVVCVATNATAVTCRGFTDSSGAQSATPSSGTCISNASFTTTTDRLQTTTACDDPKTQLCFEVYGTNGTGSGSKLWGGIQVEVASFASSYMPSGSRSADDLHFTPGTAISAAGCVSGTVEFGPVVATGGRLIGGANATGIYALDGDTIRVSDGTNTVDVDPGTMPSTSMAFHLGWSGSTMTLTVNGVSASGTFDGNMDFGTIYPGSQQGTSNHLYGWLDNLKFGASATGCQ